MQAIQNNPARPFSRFWRMLFWFTLIHLIVAAFLAVLLFVQMESRELFRTFRPKELGLIDAASLWLFLNMSLVWCALAAADMLVLRFTWRWAHGLPNPRGVVVCFLAAVLALAALHGAGGAHAAWIGSFTLSNSSYGIGRENIAPLTIFDAFLVLPSLLVLARLIFRGWPTRAPGLCVSCGYDLTGNTSGVCPECGTPATKR